MTSQSPAESKLTEPARAHVPALTQKQRDDLEELRCSPSQRAALRTLLSELDHLRKAVKPAKPAAPAAKPDEVTQLRKKLEQALAREAAVSRVLALFHERERAQAVTRKELEEHFREVKRAIMPFAGLRLVLNGLEEPIYDRVLEKLSALFYTCNRLRNMP